ncbi:dUTPase [Macrococcus capreoli]|uniref:dUTPase n=1 Tax=Macrococcus capreoli TaxID=2982690 RepID=UPI0021D60125|nr:dUTPase [Macrococcus sp. TMW 2.2395]MCU7556577.1 dUTPase [Macrococcus sp. TMW 2.2395]
MEFNYDLLDDLLTVQREFDARITTKRLGDTTLAYFVELFEWLNSKELFKNWKASPGKGLDVELDELADVLAFALSLIGQGLDAIEDEEEVALEYIVAEVNEGLAKITDGFTLDKSEITLYYIRLLLNAVFEDEQPSLTLDSLAFLLAQPFVIAEVYYNTDALIEAYKAKMARNHARQDGTADEDRGYV